MATNGRRPTPTHPPYSLMIGEAIRSLGDRKGSTESSISAYIRANFEGLPWGHDRLLPYYLNKLVLEGEFVRGVEGRYLIAQDNADDDDDEGVPIACEGDVVMQVEPLGAVSDETLVTDKSDGDVEEMQLVDPATLMVISGNVVKEIAQERRKSNRISEKLQEEEEYSNNSVPKRRGRPPKSEPVMGGKDNAKLLEANSAGKRWGRLPKA